VASVLLWTEPPDEGFSVIGFNLQSFPVRVLAVTASGAAMLLLLSCGDKDRVQVMPGPCRSLGPTDISQEEAIAVAREDAAYIDGEIQETTAAIASFRSQCIWRVTFKGVFWPPSAPAVRPTEPVCAHVEAKVWADTGKYIGLTFEHTDDCA
jgi:hypothetical protein